MKCKEARELLQQLADYTSVPELARAAEMGVQALERVERLEKEKAALLEDVKWRGSTKNSTPHRNGLIC